MRQAIIHRQHSLSEMCLDSLSQWCLQHHSSLLLLRCFSLSGPHTGAHVIICFRSLIPSIFCSFSRTDSREGVRKKKKSKSDMVKILNFNVTKYFVLLILNSSVHFSPFISICLRVMTEHINNPFRHWFSG